MRLALAAALALLLTATDAAAQHQCRYDPVRARWRCPPGQLQMYGRPRGAPTPFRPRGTPCPIYQRGDCWYGPRPMPGPFTEDEAARLRRTEHLRPTPAAVTDDEPSQEAVMEWAANYLRQGAQQKLSDSEIANQLASTIIWLEKVQLVCPTYYYVNARAARWNYLLRQGTWATVFGPGKTSTAIMNEASAKRNQEFNSSISKKDWCENVRAFGIEMFGWSRLFTTDPDP